MSFRILTNLPLGAVLWPAFLTACILEMIVFAVADPLQLHWPGGQAADLSPMAIYTLAFFAFWVMSFLCGVMVLLLARTPQQINADTD